MKKIITILLSAIMVYSLTACSAAPSNEKIKTALKDGTITVDDAKAKGWIDDEWIDKNFEKVEAKTKIYLFDPFETTYLNGTPASSELIEGKMCLVFFNTQKPETMDKFNVYNDICEEMAEIGVPVLGIITDEDLKLASEKVGDSKFPIIVFNDEMQKSLKDYKELVDTDLVSVFTKEGGFYSAWKSKTDAEDTLSTAKWLADEE